MDSLYEGDLSQIKIETDGVISIINDKSDKSIFDFLSHASINPINVILGKFDRTGKISKLNPDSENSVIN